MAVEFIPIDRETPYIFPPCVQALEHLAQLPEAPGQAEVLLADTGYFSEANVERCEEARIVPLVPEKREQHNLPLGQCYQEDPVPPQDPNPMQAMRHRLQTTEGKGLYAKRKSFVETVFGIIKQVHGFRQCLLRGLESVQSEWALVCIGWNLKRMHALNG